MTHTKLVYRALLRAIKSNIEIPGAQNQWLRFIVAQSAVSKHDPNISKAQQLVQLAKDYTFLINSVREHKDLLLSYNIGIDVDTREKEMNKRAAKLVGLSIPDKHSYEDSS